MSDIYRNTSQFVYLDILGGEADAPPTASVGETDLTVTGPITNGEAERWTAIIGFAQTQSVGEFDVVWQFELNGEPAVKVDHFSVVVPLVELDDMRFELELPEATDSQLIMGERRVRKIIEAYTNQTFAPTNEVLVVRSIGDQYLRLPKRAIAVQDIVDTRSAIPWTGYELRNDGWSLKRTSGYYYDTVTVTAPIYVPYQYGGPVRGWPSGVDWQITGLWGWTQVPSAVREAAMALLEQRMCGQTQYRDNYMASMKASDWRFDFFQESSFGTGNVVADQLLADYQAVRAAVI